MTRPYSNCLLIMNFMKQAVKRLEQVEKEINEGEKEEAGEEEDQTRLPPTSAYIAKALEDLRVYATLQGRLKFLGW